MIAPPYTLPVWKKITGCGDATILRYFQTGKLFDIQPIYPNPASSSIVIHFTGPASAVISYEVIDALGTTRMGGETSADRLSLDIHSLQNGFYTLKARNAEGRTALGRFMVVQ